MNRKKLTNRHYAGFSSVHSPKRGSRSSGELNLYESKYGRPWAGMLNNVIIFWFKILCLGGLKEFHFKAQFCCQNSKVKAKSLPSFFFEQQTLITNYIIVEVFKCEWWTSAHNWHLKLKSYNIFSTTYNESLQQLWIFKKKNYIYNIIKWKSLKVKSSISIVPNMLERELLQVS